MNGWMGFEGPASITCQSDMHFLYPSTSGGPPWLDSAGPFSVTSHVLALRSLEAEEWTGPNIAGQ